MINRISGQVLTECCSLETYLTGTLTRDSKANCGEPSPLEHYLWLIYSCDKNCNFKKNYNSTIFKVDINYFLVLITSIMATLKKKRLIVLTQFKWWQAFHPINICLFNQLQLIYIFHTYVDLVETANIWWMDKCNHLMSHFYEYVHALATFVKYLW